MVFRSKILPLLVVLIVVILIGTSVAPFQFTVAEEEDEESEVWPMFRANLENTGRNEDAESEPSDNISWTYDTQGWIDSSPIVGSDGTIYIANREGELYALSEDGEKRWSYNTTSDIFSTPAISPEGYIYLGTREGEFYSFYDNGTKRWMVNETFEGEILTSPTVRDDGTILVASNPGGDPGDVEGSNTMYSFYPNGTIQWGYTPEYNGEELVGELHSTPAVCEEGNIYFGFNFAPAPGVGNVGQLLSLDQDGNKRWNYTIGGYESPDFGASIRSSPAIGENGDIYFGAYNNVLYALDEEGDRQWRFSTEGNIFSSPAVGEDGTIYVGSEDNNLYAINPYGTERWSFDTGFLFDLDRGEYEEFLEEGNVSSELVEAFEDKGHELNIDANLTKEEENIWRVEGEDYEIKIGEERLDIYGVGDEIHSSPAIGPEGNIYFGSADEEAYGEAYSLYQNGTERWSFEMDVGILASPTIDDNGMIYIASYDENLYAVGGEPEDETDEEIEVPWGLVVILGIIGMIFILMLILMKRDIQPVESKSDDSL